MGCEERRTDFISVSCTEVRMAPREWRKSSRTWSPTEFPSLFFPTLLTLKLTTIWRERRVNGTMERGEW